MNQAAKDMLCEAAHDVFFLLDVLTAGDFWVVGDVIPEVDGSCWQLHRNRNLRSFGCKTEEAANVGMRLSRPKEVQFALRLLRQLVPGLVASTLIGTVMCLHPAENF